LKVVAVSQRVDRYPQSNESRDAVDQRLITFLNYAGFIPIPVPNMIKSSSNHFSGGIYELNRWLAAVEPAAIVLSGGNDIGQCLERDLTEERLIGYSSENNKPLLGICRGMQMLAHWAGANLKPVFGHVRTRHRLIGQIHNEVNSYHNFSVSTCPDGFEVLAKSEDGEIEAIRHCSLRWEGWMWHPEREINIPINDIQRLKELFL
jgi:gamma-glutamyl-gamma-aminobutyrate hydrolase PuuD